ncbi:MAG: hypothetical protein GX275_02295 [Clostridiales bacterium]|nr:hypothetical protein [Clostridiales bacterium]
MDNFYDRRTQYNDRYKLVKIDGDVYQISKVEGIVNQEGTELNAETMNKLVGEINTLNKTVGIGKTSDLNKGSNIENINYLNKAKEELLASIVSVNTTGIKNNYAQLFKIDTSKKFFLRGEALYDSVNNRFIAPYEGWFTFNVATFINPQQSNTSYYHSTIELFRYPADNSTVEQIVLGRNTNFSGMSSINTFTINVYMNKSDGMDIRLVGNSANTYAIDISSCRISITGRRI